MNPDLFVVLRLGRVAFVIGGATWFWTKREHWRLDKIE